MMLSPVSPIGANAPSGTVLGATQRQLVLVRISACCSADSKGALARRATAGLLELWRQHNFANDGGKGRDGGQGRAAAKPFEVAARHSGYLLVPLIITHQFFVFPTRTELIFGDGCTGLFDWFAVDLGFTKLLFIQIDLCVLCVFVL